MIPHDDLILGATYEVEYIGPSEEKYIGKKFIAKCERHHDDKIFHRDGVMFYLGEGIGYTWVKLSLDYQEYNWKVKVLKEISRPVLPEVKNKLVFENDKEFEKACEPLMKYLSDNCNPHTIAVVESNCVVVYGGEKTYNTNKFLKD